MGDYDFTGALVVLIIIVLLLIGGAYLLGKYMAA